MQLHRSENSALILHNAENTRLGTDVALFPTAGYFMEYQDYSLSIGKAALPQ